MQYQSILQNPRCLYTRTILSATIFSADVWVSGGRFKDWQNQRHKMSYNIMSLAKQRIVSLTIEMLFLKKCIKLINLFICRKTIVEMIGSNFDMFSCFIEPFLCVFLINLFIYLFIEV